MALLITPITKHRFKISDVLEWSNEVSLAL
jgi:hypothetical protein